MEKLWLHSLATAYASRSIAEMMHMEEKEKYFLMGLVHDIGKVLLIKALSESTKDLASLDTEAIITILQDIHTNFGGTILRRWGFSEDFVRIALLHEGPTYTDTTDKDVLIVNLANHVAHEMGYNLNGSENGGGVQHVDSFRLLETDIQAFEKMCGALKKQMEETVSIF
jgi:HD-like signal output (HDOD) protein